MTSAEHLEQIKDISCGITILLTFCVVVLIYIYAYFFQLRMCPKKPDFRRNSDLPNLPPLKLTVEKLAGFNGTRPDGRILLALKGNIYDVSSNKSEFGVGGILNHVAGKDLTRFLEHIMRIQGSGIDYVSKWKETLETNYHIVGQLVPTLEENTPKQKEEEEYKQNEKVDEHKQNKEELKINEEDDEEDEEDYGNQSNSEESLDSEFSELAD